MNLQNCDRPFLIDDEKLAHFLTGQRPAAGEERIHPNGYARIVGPDRQMQLLGGFATAGEAGRACDRARAELGLPVVNLSGETTA